MKIACRYIVRKRNTVVWEVRRQVPAMTGSRETVDYPISAATTWRAAMDYVLAELGETR